MAPVSFRLADFSSEFDVNAFVMLIDLYSRDPFGSGHAMPQEILEVLPERWRKHPGAFTVLALSNDRPVGLANCLTSFSTFKAKARINIHDLVVHPEVRGQGVGRKLIEAVCDEGCRREACQVTLEVRADNEYARALYERCGFRGIENPVQESTHFFGVRALG